MIKNQETELRLIVCGNSPETILSNIAQLRQICKYYLLPEKNQKIYDCYFDTYFNDLARAKFGLRIRDVNNKKFITLKGKPVKSNNGLVQRLEIEKSWSQENWLRIVSYLKKKLNQLQIEKKLNNQLEPEKALEQIGLRIIQQRKNYRQVRSVVVAEKENHPFAELALDSLAFIVQGTEIYLFEIEIELKESGNFEVIRIIARGLQQQFADSIQPWNHGKLSTGIAIDNLWGEDDFKKTLDTNNCLTCNSYQLIQGYFESR